MENLPRQRVVTITFYPPVFHIAPSSVSCADSYGLRCFALDCIELSPGQFDPRGEAFREWKGYLSGLVKSLPLGGKVGRPEAGSDEGVPGGFHGVGNRRTGLRWQRDSSTRRYYHIAPSSVTFGDSFPPRGSLRASVRWGDYYGSFLHKPHRACQKPSPGGPTVRGTVGYQINSSFALKVGRPYGPGRMRASLEDSTASGIAPPTPTI